MARKVTGPENALYTDPNDAPYYDTIQQQHAEMEPLVKEHVRHRRKSLKRHWTELAEEYEYRQSVYKKQQERSAKTASTAAVVMVRQWPVGATQIGGGNAVSAGTPASGGAAGRPNPYRRARREARTEYELEQNIAEINAKELMERRIKTGGCALPRQVGRLERMWTASFQNTFHAQRVDVLEQETQLKNSNVWSDMEKCIFLDRYVQPSGTATIALTPAKIVVSF